MFTVAVVVAYQPIIVGSINGLPSCPLLAGSGALPSRYLSRACALPGAVLPPSPFLGRSREQHLGTSTASGMQQSLPHHPNLRRHHLDCGPNDAKRAPYQYRLTTIRSLLNSSASAPDGDMSPIWSYSPYLTCVACPKESGSRTEVLRAHIRTANPSAELCETDCWIYLSDSHGTSPSPSLF